MNILITLCARGGSKGVPDKNIKPLNAKPLIAYSISKALKLITQLKERGLNCILELSTDSEKIKAVAEEYQLFTNYVRPKHLGSDFAGKIDVINDILIFSEKERNMTFDVIIDLDITSPLRTVDDIIQSFDILIKNKDAVNIFSVSNPHRNPYFNVIEENEDGFVKVVKSLKSQPISRQEAPKVYDMNASFYLYKKYFFEKEYKSAITDKSLAFLMTHICFDIDNQMDFEILEFLISESKLDFEFE